MVTYGKNSSKNEKEKKKGTFHTSKTMLLTFAFNYSQSSLNPYLLAATKFKFTPKLTSHTPYPLVTHSLSHPPRGMVRLYVLFILVFYLLSLRPMVSYGALCCESYNLNSTIPPTHSPACKDFQFLTYTYTLALAQRNAQIYSVVDHIEFVL